MNNGFRGFTLGLAIFLAPHLHAEPLAQDAATIRIATYNISFYRNHEGQMADQLERGDQKARQIAGVLQRVRPDIVLLNEFDWDADGRGTRLFQEKCLAVSQYGLDPLEYAHVYQGPVNTGEPSGLDLDQDGKRDGPADAYGFGRYPGQYGMVLLSRFPIALDDVRTFQKFLWKEMPDTRPLKKPGTEDNYYSNEVLSVFRLSSKSFWDVPIVVPIGGKETTLHLLCSHPTPPVFDGPENRNGLRNHDEIRLLADYIDPARSAYLVDDHGKRGGLAEGAAFVIAGDLNADPIDGGSSPANIKQLLEHPLVNAKLIPESDGGERVAKERQDLNADHQGNSRHDTADFSGDGHGNLRVDYVLPSRNLRAAGTGMFWPLPGEPGAKAIRATDHRLVYLDIEIGQE